VLINYDIILSKLKLNGLSDKDLQLYQSYLDNRYCRTTIYNDSENSNTVSDGATVTHGIPQYSILGPPTFYFVYKMTYPRL